MKFIFRILLFSLLCTSVNAQFFVRRSGSLYRIDQIEGFSGTYTFNGNAIPFDGSGGSLLAGSSNPNSFFASSIGLTYQGNSATSPNSASSLYSLATELNSLHSQIESLPPVVEQFPVHDQGLEVCGQSGQLSLGRKPGSNGVDGYQYQFKNILDEPISVEILNGTSRDVLDSDIIAPGDTYLSTGFVASAQDSPDHIFKLNDSSGVLTLEHSADGRTFQEFTDFLQDGNLRAIELGVDVDCPDPVEEIPEPVEIPDAPDPDFESPVLEDLPPSDNPVEDVSIGSTADPAQDNAQAIIDAISALADSQASQSTDRRDEAISTQQDIRTIASSLEQIDTTIRTVAQAEIDATNRLDNSVENLDTSVGDLKDSIDELTNEITEDFSPRSSDEVFDEGVSSDGVEALRASLQYRELNRTAYVLRVPLSDAMSSLDDIVIDFGDPDYATLISVVRGISQALLYVASVILAFSVFGKSTFTS